MKTSVKILFFFGLLLSLSACNVNEALSKEVEIKDNVVEFDLVPSSLSVSSQLKVASAEATTDTTLLDKTYDVNVSLELSSLGLSIDLIKAFAITNAKLEVTIPEIVTDKAAFMQGFNNLKVYFNDKTNLVAQINGTPTFSGQTGLVEIKIVNGDLLDELKEDQLHVIITGNKYPSVTSHCKFTSSYKVRVGLLK